MTRFTCKRGELSRNNGLIKLNVMHKNIRPMSTKRCVVRLKSSKRTNKRDEARRNELMGAGENKQLMQDLFSEMAKGNSEPLIQSLADDFVC
jgi:hypothetical protein